MWDTCRKRTPGGRRRSAAFRYIGGGMTELHRRADLAENTRGAPRRVFYFLAALVALVYSFRFFVYAQT